MGKRFIETVTNPLAINIASIPVLDYKVFTEVIDEMMASEGFHCIAYYVIPEKEIYRFICAMADDTTGKVMIFSHSLSRDIVQELPSITARHFAFHIFEREIHENFGIPFTGHPWLKPVRYPSGRFDGTQIMNNYPFYMIDGDELHEVGVGPIHAGVIEPEHFRFICRGEHVLHLEIQLGYQHRGIEKLFIEQDGLLRRCILSECITGDTVIGHSLCHSLIMESLGGIGSPSLDTERSIALELERIAMHIGDTAALCGDIAYQFGQVVNEALRTIIINTTQLWCGNRFGKGLIRPGGTNYPLNGDLKKIMIRNLEDVEQRYRQITSNMFTMSSVLSRFEMTGTVTKNQAILTGAVGMAARSSGLERDIRSSHPFLTFQQHPYKPVILDSGDVWARTMMRNLEVEKSVAFIKQLLNDHQVTGEPLLPAQTIKLQPGTFSLAMTEGWRGEIVHSALTDDHGKLVHYKVKDPSFHNWMVLALAVRNQEISDFPLCNKSFNLSYCGNDL